MNASDQVITEQQEALLKQFGEFNTMRAGTITRQHYPARRARKKGKGASGPYFLWQGYRDGKRFAKRVSAQQANMLRQQIEHRKQFEDLCKEYIGLCEAQAELHERTSASEEAVKKGLKSRSKKTLKSNGSSK